MTLRMTTLTSRRTTANHDDESYLAELEERRLFAWRMLQSRRMWGCKITLVDFVCARCLGSEPGSSGQDFTTWRKGNLLIRRIDVPIPTTTAAFLGCLPKS
eukprot:2018510-Pleurochrysis_carterae.AAC.6